MLLLRYSRKTRWSVSILMPATCNEILRGRRAGKVVTAIFGVKMKMRVVVNWSFSSAFRVFSEGFPFANGKKAIKNENSHLNWMQMKVEVWGTVILGRRFQKLINSHWSLMEKCAEQFSLCLRVFNIEIFFIDFPLYQAHKSITPSPGVARKLIFGASLRAVIYVTCHQK